MNRETQQELERLERELLEEEGPSGLSEADLDALLEDFLAGEDEPDLYRNFSNDYGRRPSYQAYNSDDTDIPPEEYGDQLLETNVPRGNGLLALMWGILLVMGGILVWLLLRFT